MVLRCHNTGCTFFQDASPEDAGALCPACGAGLCELTPPSRRRAFQAPRRRPPRTRPFAHPRHETGGKIVGRRVEGTPHGSPWVTVNGQPLSPRPSQQVVNHSPDGFDWGYGGAGPAQLALAIALLFCRPATAVRLYQEFKWRFIAPCPADGFELDMAVAQAWFLRQALRLAA